MRLSQCVVLAVDLAALAYAQFPSLPTDLTVISSKLQPDVIISYKQNHICGPAKAWSGYVHLPSKVLGDVGDYNISTFFWYFPAQNNPSTAPLAIYLAGGPGESSIYTATASESGPCYVNVDGNSTTINPWSLNNHVNVLYIDQPVQAGFSYDSLVNGTFDLETGAVAPVQASENIPASNATFGFGTFASQNPLTTTNTTVTSVKALWHFAENWLTQFPEYQTENKKISVWGNSYGGYWAPAATAYFDKNFKDAPKESPLQHFKMDTMGITNGCIDLLYMLPFYPELAYNNTYQVEFIPEAVYQEATQNFTKPGGCRDLIEQCRELGEQGDPDWIGANQTVNEACILATDYCTFYVMGAFNALNNRSAFDMAVQYVDGQDPCPYYLPVFRFFNQEWVQKAMGVPLNFTYDSNVVTAQFSLDPTHPTQGTGDSVRKDLKDFEYVLQNGIKAAMIYGDRDYRCPWLAAENVALVANYSDHQHFVNSGYEKIVTNATYSGGVTKQYDKFSFSRVFEAGHSVSAYQPETVYRIFMRSMFDRDVATGNHDIVGAKYSSTGPKSSWGIKNVLPTVPSTCMIEGQFQNVSVWEDFW